MLRPAAFGPLALLWASIGGCGAKAGPADAGGAAGAAQAVSLAPPVPTPRAACARPLTLWPALKGDELRFAEARARAFARQTGVAVEVASVPFDELRERYVRAAEGGQGPDLLYGPNDWGGALADAGLVADVGGRVDAKKYFHLTVDAATYRGKLLGVPESFEVITQYYNAALLPGGLARFDEAAAAAARVPPGAYVVAYDAASFYYSAAFLHAAGGALFDDEGNFILREDAAARWLALTKRVWQAGGVPKEGRAQAAKALFLEGKVGAYFSGPWDLADVTRGRASWQLAKLPSPPEGEAKPFLGVKLLYLSRACPCPEAALAFAEAFAGLETELEWVRAVNPAHLPALSAVYREAAVRENPATQGFLAQAEASVPFPNVPAMSHVWGPADAALASVLERGVAPAAAAKKMIATIRAHARAPKPVP
jgi:maltose-binding protein MalE